MFNRRSFLRAAPAAAVTVAVAAPATASAPLPDTRPHAERLREKVAELKALMVEVYPEADFLWLDAIERTKACPLLVSVTTRSGPIDLAREGLRGKQA